MQYRYDPREKVISLVNLIATVVVPPCTPVAALTATMLQKLWVTETSFHIVLD